jgi:hypothetical protein
MILEGSIILPGGWELLVWMKARDIDQRRRRSLDGPSAKPSMVAKPGMVGFLSVQACLLFAG